MDYISFFKPEIGEDEVNEVSDCLRSGWLTTGARCKRFEEDFARYIGRPEAVAVNSCTAALHLALEAVGLKEKDVVLVPTMTFAATAEVVRYFNAIPVLVDCHADDFCMDMDHAERILDAIAAGRGVPGLPDDHGPVKGIIPVHYAGQAADVLRCRALADKHHLFIVLSLIFKMLPGLCSSFHENARYAVEPLLGSGEHGPETVPIKYVRTHGNPQDTHSTRKQFPFFLLRSICTRDEDCPLGKFAAHHLRSKRNA